MRAGPGARVAAGLAAGLALLLATSRGGRADEPSSAEIRVLSESVNESAITLRAAPDTAVVDRTPGARPAEEARGPASVGETFTSEITLLLRGVRQPRQAQIDVADALVSTVRLFPDPDGTLVVVFIRQPVTYTVSRPSALGEIRIALQGRTEAAQIVHRSQRGRVRVERPTPESNEVSVDAETLEHDQQNDVLIARGNVTLTRGNMTLRADEVRYDKKNAVADAHGHVVLVEPQATVEGDAAHLTLDDETGWVDAPTGEMRLSRYQLQGTRLDKQLGPHYTVANGIFTTCRCGGLEKPSWSVAGDTTEVTVGGTGKVRDMTFRVKDVPVFWFPYFIFPANNERQSGLLLPRVGYSNRRGMQWEQPFFWAIDKSSDATFAVDVETRARIGVLGNYEYRLSKQAAGSFTAAYWNEQIRGRTNGVTSPNGQPAHIPTDRFAFFGHHAQPFVWDSKFYVDMFAVSDDTLLKEMNTFSFAGRRDLAQRSSRFTKNDVGVIKTWDQGLVQLETDYYQDLVDRQQTTPQRLPRLTVEHGMPLLGDLLVGRVSAEASDFQREQAYHGLRADLAPELFLPVRIGRFLSGSVSGQLRETAYHLFDRDPLVRIEPDEPTRAASFRAAKPGDHLSPFSSDRTRTLPVVNARLASELSRTYDFPFFGLEKLRHTIEPEVRYFYVPPTGRPHFAGHLPSCAALKAQLIEPRVAGVDCNASFHGEGFLFDERDAYNHRSFVSYGFSTRILGRGPLTAAAPADDDGAKPARRAAVPFDSETLAQGLDADAVPTPTVPPPPAAAKGEPPPPTPPARELLRFSMLHGFDLARKLLPDKNSRMSDVDLGLKMTPLDYVGASYNATVDFQTGILHGQNVAFAVHDPTWKPLTSAPGFQSPSTLGISYRFIDSAETAAARAGRPAPDVKEIDGSLYLQLGSYVGLNFFTRYDLAKTIGPPVEGPHFFERSVLFRLISKCNCWVVDAGFIDRTNPDERLIRVQVTLLGLGSIGEGRGRQNYVGLAPLTALGYTPPGALRRGGPAGGMY